MGSATNVAAIVFEHDVMATAHLSHIFVSPKPSEASLQFGVNKTLHVGLFGPLFRSDMDADGQRRAVPVRQ